MTDRAVILARGLGTRMRRADARAELDPRQKALADAGMKALIPVGAGRPFLDYVLDTLASAGLTRICLVVAPDHDLLRRRYREEVALERIAIDFAVQPEPRGTADAVLAAEAWTAGEPFVVLNSDNDYPVDALRALATLDTPGVIAFGRAGLLSTGQISPERIAAYALLDLHDGRLVRIVEKPDAATLAATGPDARVSMNCWRFDQRVFEACRRVPLSPRGELELPQAVQLALREGLFEVAAVLSDEPVLDLSSRADIGVVARLVEGRSVRL
ncbi:MAG TPA: nucleotidyltransferase family protein [Vicinamibacterales bacterium]